MATIPPSLVRAVEYPTSDGKPMAETGVHVRVILSTIATLDQYFEDDPDVYVGGNGFLCYVEGDGNKHVSPDVQVTRGVPKLPPRDNYLVWKEGKPPDVVIEVTSRSTRGEDENAKFALYRDVIKVPEYFLFDPRAEWLRPPLKGYRLIKGRYVPIKPAQGRLPSAALGLELERDGRELRFFDPATGRRVLTPREFAKAAEAKADAAEAKADAAEAKADAAEAKADTAEAKADAAEAEAARLRQELEALKQRFGEPR